MYTFKLSNIDINKYEITPPPDECERIWEINGTELLAMISTEKDITWTLENTSFVLDVVTETGTLHLGLLSYADGVFSFMELAAQTEDK